MAELEQNIRDKEGQLEEATGKFNKLKTEAKAKLKALKDELQEANEKLHNSEKGTTSFIFFEGQWLATKINKLKRAFSKG